MKYIKEIASWFIYGTIAYIFFMVAFGLAGL